MSRLSLPQLDPGETRQMNSIAGLGRKLRFETGGKPWTLHFRTRLPAFEPVHRLALRIGENPAQLDLEQLPEPGVFAPQFAGTLLRDLPEALWMSVLEAALEPLLDRAGQAFHSTFELVEIQTATPDSSLEGKLLYLELRDGTDSLIARGRLELVATDRQRLAALLEPVVPEPSELHIRRVPFAARILVGETRLNVEELRTVERGDVVLLDRHGTSEDPLCDVFLTHALRFRARRQNRHIIIDQMATDTPPTIQPSGNTSLETLPVHLVFEAGQKQLTLGELQRLSTGFTFELDASPDDFLTIRANGQAIGTGELVQIGDRVGVRVLEWHPKQPATNGVAANH